MIFERQRRASPNLPPSTLNRGKQYGGTVPKDPAVPLWICLNCGLADGQDCPKCGSSSVIQWVPFLASTATDAKGSPDA